MTEETTTIKIYRTDAPRLREKLPTLGTDADRMRAILNNTLPECPHPEATRTYTTALIPAPGTDALTEHTMPTRVYGGYHCGACDRYIIPNADARVVETEGR